MAFLHGIEVIERADNLKPLRPAPTSVIGLVGSAGKGPVNTPTLIAGDRTRAAAVFGGAGTIPDALEAIFAQAAVTVVAVNVFDPAVRLFAAADYVFDGEDLDLPATTVTGLSVQPSGGGTPRVAGGTVTDEEVTISGNPGSVQVTGRNIRSVVVRRAAGGTAYDVTNDYTLDAATGTVTRVAVGAIAANATIYVSYTYGDYTLDAATGTVTRVAGGAIAANATVQATFRGAPKISTVTAADVRGAAGQNPTGIAALTSAESVTGYAPRLLIAPGFTDDETTAQALIGIADRTRGVAILDGPSTTDDEARTYAAGFDARRAYLVDPGVRVADAAGDVVDRPASAYVAGVIARVDTEIGFWRSPSNYVLAGVLGTSRPISFGLSDTASDANLLNQGNVATIVRHGGYRLWGSRTLSSATEWAFLSVVRIADALTINLQENHLWAVDRNIGPTYLDEVSAAVNGYIQELIGLGGLLSGECRPSPDLNTPASIASGQVYFDIDFRPPTPAERVTFRTRLVQQADLEEAS